jgi:DNA-binding GntR family transcriptional regulator
MSQDRGTLLSEQAYRRLKRMIISLELEPGAIVRESALRDQLGLGRTPIREALQRLALEQLIEIIPRQGIFVTRIAINDLKHLFEVRIPLETLAARLAAERGRSAHWAPMEKALGVIDPAPKEFDNEALIQVDEQCHQIIYRASGNEYLARVATTLYSSSLRLWYYFLEDIGDMRDAVAEHRSILEAVKASDADLAGELMERHIRAFHREIQAAIGRQSLSPAPD